MVKRQARAIGLAVEICNHESPNPPKLSDRTGDQIDLDEIERIRT
jgi:hypothetical protein